MFVNNLVEIPKHYTRQIDPIAGRAASTGPAVIELVIVVDKDFGDMFQQNYQKIVDYLTIYFWDVNMRYKSLWSVDLSIRVNGLLIMAVKHSQLFDHFTHLTIFFPSRTVLSHSLKTLEEVMDALNTAER